MNRAADLGAEHGVDAPVLFDPAELGEFGRDHLGVEVVAAAGEVLDFSMGSGNGFLDALLKLCSARHGVEISGLDGATLGKALDPAKDSGALNVITFTDNGAEKVREFLVASEADVQTSGLRVGVRGGGCSGFQYALAFDTERDGDQIFEDQGLRLLVDAASLPYVQGAVIDYVNDLQGAGFKVNNPNIVAACGCGSSFRVAEEEEVSAV